MKRDLRLEVDVITGRREDAFHCLLILFILYEEVGVFSGKKHDITTHTHVSIRSISIN